jgi:non-heme chloroperoxidase
MLPLKLVKVAVLKVYPGASYGLCSTPENEINEDLLAFFKQ